MEGIKPSEDCSSNKTDLALVVETEEMTSDVRPEGSEAEIVFVDDEKVIDLLTVEARANKTGMEASTTGSCRSAHDSDIIEATADISRPQVETRCEPMEPFPREGSREECKGTDVMLSYPEENVEFGEKDSGDADSDKERFCNCLRSLKDLASPDVLQALSSEEIFEAHHSLTDVTSVVVQALRGRWQSPRSKKRAVQDIQ